MAYPDDPIAVVLAATAVTAYAHGAILRLSPATNDFDHAAAAAAPDPTCDEGRVDATARVRAAVRKLDWPVRIVGRDFFSDCGLRVDGLVPFPGGVPLKPLVDRLDAFPKPAAWSVYLRRPLVRLSAADTDLLAGELKPLLVARSAALDSYPTRA